MTKMTVCTMLAVCALAVSGARAEVQKAETPDYPLTTCVVTGKTLGSMGEPMVLQHEGREVRFCCEGCREPFLKDPAKYLKKLDEAAAAAGAAEVPAQAPAKPAKAATKIGCGGCGGQH